ncbi:unnamed protein product, partial [Symbiodinium sp. KB8]
DDLVEAGQRLFSVRVQKATFEEISDGHHTAVLEFNEAGGLRIDEEHLIWEDLAGYYPETREQLLRLPSAGVLLQAHQAKAKAPALGITGPTKGLYQPFRRDPLRRRRVPAAEELVEEDVGTRRTREHSSEIGEEGAHTAKAEPEATEEEPTAEEPTVKEEPATTGEAEAEETEGQQDHIVSAEGAAEGAPGEGAEEEEDPEQDVEVEIEVPASASERTRSPSPEEQLRVQRTAHREDAAEALSAPDPYDLPEEEEVVQYRGLPETHLQSPELRPQSGLSHQASSGTVGEANPGGRRGKSGSWPPKRRAPSHDEGAASEGDTPRSSAPVSRSDLPKKAAVRPVILRKVPPADKFGVRYKAAPSYPPGSVPQAPPQYKGPPHEVFVRNVAGKKGPETRSTGKAPPPQVTGNRQKLAYHAWAQQQRAEEEAQAAASGAASSSRVPRVLATRTEATVVFDWHNVLDKAWVENKKSDWSTRRGTHGYFKPAFTEALKNFVVEHRPVCVAILSYCSRSSAAWYETHFLRTYQEDRA